MRNNSILVGRLSKDPSLQKTANGISYLHVTLISERDYKKNGKKEVDGIPCVVWRKTAELMVNYLNKGTLIDVSGRLQSRIYTKEGQRHFVVELLVEDFHILESRSVIEQRAATRNNPSKLPYEEENGSYDPFGMGEDILEINDDDVPF